MEYKIQAFNLIVYTIAFILFTVIGTLSHEFGHIGVAKALGYETKLHYGSMSYSKETLTNEISELRREHGSEIESGANFPEKKEYEKLLLRKRLNSLLISAGGPFQTILTGVIGLLILYFRKNRIILDGLKLIDWIAVFLSLFWLREIFNLTVSVANGIFGSSKSYFGGDEMKISKMLNLPSGTLSIVLGIIGLLISLFVIFRIVPRSARFTFICAGFLGGVSGFVLWMKVFGPIILP